MQKLIDLQDPAFLQQGLFPDVPANQLGLWKTGKNVEFRDNAARKAVGRTVEDTRAAPVYALSQAYVGGIRRAYAAQAAKVHKWEYGVPTEIGTGFGGLGYWSLEPWGEWLLATNDYDEPQVWKNAGTMEDLEGVRRARFRLIKKHRNHVLGYWGQNVDWSDESNPELWEPDEDNKAGSFFIRDLNSDIVAAQPLGQHFGVYSFDSMVIQQYVGAPFYFGFPQAINGIGAVSDSAIIDVGNRHFGMSLKGIFTTDGIAFNYVDTPQIKLWLKANLDKDNMRRVVGLHDEENQTVKWWFPCLDATIKGVAFNYVTRAWTILEDAITAAAGYEIYEAPLVAAGTSWGFASGSDAGAGALVAELQTFPLDAQKREQYKLWDLLVCDFEGTGLEVRFGFSDTPDGAIEWQGWADVSKENWIGRESLFLHVGFRSTGVGDDWKISGMSIHGEVTGWF